MLLLGEVLGRKAEAEAFVTYWRAQLAVVTDRLAKARPEAPTVFLENRVGLSDGCCDTMVGLVGKLLGAAGSRNVAKDLIPGEFGTLNPEFLIARQPRFYIGTGIGALATQQQMPLRVVLGADATPEAAQASLARAVQRRGIAQLQAVKEGRAYAMWHHFYNSPFNVVAVQVFAKWLHPELFADLDPRATLQTMYDRFQPIALEGVYWTALKP
jgi:iron complex transport system substrate-binding protein